MRLDPFGSRVFEGVVQEEFSSANIRVMNGHTPIVTSDITHWLKGLHGKRVRLTVEVLDAHLLDCWYCNSVPPTPCPHHDGMNLSGRSHLSSDREYRNTNYTMKNSPRPAIATFTQTHTYLGTDIISLCQEHILEAPRSDNLTTVEFNVAAPGTCCTRCQDIKDAYDLHIKTKYGR